MTCSCTATSLSITQPAAFKIDVTNSRAFAVVISMP